MIGETGAAFGGFFFWLTLEDLNKICYHVFIYYYDVSSVPKIMNHMEFIYDHDGDEK